MNFILYDSIYPCGLTLSLIMEYEIFKYISRIKSLDPLAGWRSLRDREMFLLSVQSKCLQYD